MTPADLSDWERELNGVVTRIHPLFYRAESRKHAEQYLRGLLAPLARKNGWTIAEYVGEPEPKALQRLLNLSPWDGEELLTISRGYAMENLADPGGILVADSTGFAKKGRKPVGVQRQYSGTLGRIDNCQIATFLAYVTPHRDRVLIDYRLYLPEKSWMADPDRCAQAGVPPEITFQTRPQQVQDMVEATRAARFPFAWFTADEEFGQNPGLCAYLEREQIPYLMAVPKNTTFLDAAGVERVIETHAKRLPRNTWQRRACGIGSKGHRVYDWALVEPAETNRQYMIRRSIDDGELAYYRCHNPNQAGFGELVHVAGARWPIEECFESGKNETGLDNYQVRTWTRLAPPYRLRRPRPHPPRRHRPQSQKKGANFRKPQEPEAPNSPEPIHRRLIPLTLAEIRRLLNIDRRDKHAVTHALQWSTWRRRHQTEARRAHFRRHLRLQRLTI